MKHQILAAFLAFSPLAYGLDHIWSAVPGADGYVVRWGETEELDVGQVLSVDIEALNLTAGEVYHVLTVPYVGDLEYMEPIEPAALWTDVGPLVEMPLAPLNFRLTLGGGGLTAWGTVDNVTDEWVPVSYPRSFVSPVVVAAPIYSAESVPAVVRVRNVAGAGFELQLANPSGQPVAPASVSWIAAEAGSYNEADHGVIMTVGRHVSTVTNHAGQNWGGGHPLSSDYSSPVVLSQVMTANDPNWSTAWSQDLLIGKHVGEDPNTSRQAETLGYIVIEAGAHSNGWTAGITAQIIRGFSATSGRGHPVPLSSFAVISGATRNGSNGHWPVIVGEGMVAVDEDQLNDDERDHAIERVSYITIGD